MAIRPRIPGIIQNIQLIKYYAFNPCDAPFMLYIETALPIAGEIAVAFLTFDLISFVKTLFRPKWVRTGSHTRTGRKGNRRRGGIPEVADLVADRLDPDRLHRPPHYRLAGLILIEISDQYERAAWSFFLMEVIQGYIINTVVGVIEASPDGCPHIGRMLREDKGITIGAVTPGWQPLNVHTLRYENLVPSTTGFGALPLYGKHCAVFAVRVYKNIDPGSVRIRLVVTSPTFREVDVSSWIPMDEGDIEEIIVSGEVQGGEHYQWHTEVTDGFAVVRDCSVFDMQIGE